MVLVGNPITTNDVVADPRHLQLKPMDVSTMLLSSYTMEQMGKYDYEATKRINAIKEEYGKGVSSLIRIYNASGRTLKFQQQGPNWSGHMWKYPFDEGIRNGEWSVILHVKTSGAMRGSVSCFVYTVEDEGLDVFCGWSNPWDRNLYSNQVYTEVRDSGHWPSGKSWNDMYYRVIKGGESSKSEWPGKTASMLCTAHTGNVSFPQVNFIISGETMEKN